MEQPIGEVIETPKAIPKTEVVILAEPETIGGTSAQISDARIVVLRGTPDGYATTNQ